MSRSRVGAMPTRVEMIRLSAQQARSLHLAAQGLLAPPRRRARKADILMAIRRMQLLQIDTINIVARSPYLVLFSRLGAYPREWLDATLAEGAIFECWAHEACFAPIADYALHRTHVDSRHGHWAMRRALNDRREHNDQIEALLARIRADGAVRSQDFERSDGGKGGGWWGWKNEKRWLDALFTLGDLMIARRENFQRVYDVRERVLANVHARNAGVGADHAVSAAELRDEFALRAVRALGVTQARWINDYFRSGGKFKDPDLDAFVDAGVLSRVEVAGWRQIGYVHADHAELLVRAAAGRLRATQVTLLSPFDPVVWDRERASAMFGFDYRIECYLPAAKRTFGYFVLPILSRGRLIGRLDAKAHRGDGVFEVKALFLEPGITATPRIVDDIASALRRAADWHRCGRVVVGGAQDKALRKSVTQTLIGDRADDKPARSDS